MDRCSLCGSVKPTFMVKISLKELMDKCFLSYDSLIGLARNIDVKVWDSYVETLIRVSVPDIFKDFPTYQGASYSSDLIDKAQTLLRVLEGVPPINIMVPILGKVGPAIVKGNAYSVLIAPQYDVEGLP